MKTDGPSKSRNPDRNTTGLPPAYAAPAPRTRGSLWDLAAAGICLAVVAVVLLSVLIPIIARAG